MEILKLDTIMLLAFVFVFFLGLYLGMQIR